MKTYRFTSVKNSKERLDMTSEPGFSVLEAIVVVGVVLALSIASFSAYGAVVKNAKYAKVKHAASVVYSAVLTYEIDGNPATAPQDAIEQYNSSNTAIKVYLNDSNGEPLIATMTTGVKTSGNGFDESKYCVLAEHSDDTTIKASTGKCPSSIENDSGSDPGGGGTPPGGTGEYPAPGDTSTGNPSPDGSGGGSGGGTPTPTPTPTSPGTNPTIPPDEFTTIVKYQCATTKFSKLPFRYVQNDAVVKVTPMSTGISKTIYKEAGDDSYETTLQAGEKYMAILSGNFGKLSHEESTFKDCVTSVDQIGDASGVATLSYLGTGTFTVPDKIPASVTSINSAFAGATNFNDPNVSLWNTSNVQDMAFVFNNAEKFNQPLSYWSTSKVTDMASMFSGAKSFNQPLNSWNTGLVQSMHSMFYGASTFNQPVSSWNTTQVKQMARMFSGATVFNQSISTWNVGSVINMKSMFESAVVFNQPLNGWDVDHVEDMSFMFYKAHAFNQPLSSWIPEDVTTMSSMFAEATVFNQNITRWDIDEVTSWSNFRNLSALTSVNTPSKFR